LSVTFDANVLLYASDEPSKHQLKARSFLAQLATGDDLVYLFWPTIMAYVRIATHPAIFERPLPLEVAIGNIDRLLALHNVQTTGERDRFWSSYRQLALEADARGNLVPDAHLVALMIENGVRTVWTHDRDYRRFTAVEARDPFG
jgi:toxin-antitoxin system PIN domain toxin